MDKHKFHHNLKYNANQIIKLNIKKLKLEMLNVFNRNKFRLILLNLRIITLEQQVHYFQLNLKFQLIDIEVCQTYLGVKILYSRISIKLMEQKIVKPIIYLSHRKCLYKYTISAPINNIKRNKPLINSQNNLKFLR